MNLNYWYEKAVKTIQSGIGRSGNSTEETPISSNTAKAAMRLILFEKSKIHFSGAGIRDQQNVSNLPFFFVILEYLHIDIGQPSKLFR